MGVTMVLRVIKNVICKNIFLKIFICIIVLILLILYFNTFFTKGAYFYGIFLKKQVVASGSYYTGDSKRGSIEIIVNDQMKNQNVVDVIYKLPYKTNLQYTVNFHNADYQEIAVENIKDKAGKIVFSDGTYIKSIHSLLPKDGQGIFDMQVLVNGESPYNSDLRTYPENDISLSNVVSFAVYNNDTIRGKYEYLVPAIVLFILTIIDIRFPLFFFTLNHFLDVKDPEPSDLYITMQRKFWYISPIISVILMLVAIF